MAKNRYLRRKDFHLWLEAIVDSGEVGSIAMTRDIHLCPVARYLDSQTNREWHTSALACVPQVRSEVEDHEFKTPKWAREFIQNLDRHFGRYPTSVTAEDCLYVMDEYE